jgi:putative polyhydroxyalkanoate system protein
MPSTLFNSVRAARFFWEDMAMSEIRIRRTHSLALEAARGVAESLAAKLKKDFDLAWVWKRNVLHFERPGINGELHVTDHDIRLEARLGLLLGFLKPRIEQEIEAQFDKYFRPPARKAPAGKKAAHTSGAAAKPRKVSRR